MSEAKKIKINKDSEAIGVDTLVIMRCLKKGCPRTKNTPFDSETMPIGTVEIRSDCPWHLEEGNKGYPENYYDKDGNEIDYYEMMVRPKIEALATHYNGKLIRNYLRR